MYDVCVDGVEFDAIERGVKSFLVIPDDRGWHVGEIIVLRRTVLSAAVGEDAIRVADAARAPLSFPIAYVERGRSGISVSWCVVGLDMGDRLEMLARAKHAVAVAAFWELNRVYSELIGVEREPLDCLLAVINEMPEWGAHVHDGDYQAAEFAIVCDIEEGDEDAPARSVRESADA